MGVAVYSITTTCETIEDLVAHVRKQYPHAFVQFFHENVPIEDIFFAYAEALSACAEKSAWTNDLAKETLVRLARTHQIGKAIESVGVRNPRSCLIITDAPLVSDERITVQRTYTTIPPTPSQGKRE